MKSKTHYMKSRNRFWDAFYFSLGFGNPPNQIEVMEVISKDSTEKIKDDLGKVRTDLKKSFSRLISETC
jgi:hypothetical protein